MGTLPDGDRAMIPFRDLATSTDPVPDVEAGDPGSGMEPMRRRWRAMKTAFAALIDGNFSDTENVRA